MPDRILRTSAGVLGGFTIILGLTYAWIGITWLISPTPTRLAGIEWAPINAHTVGIWWVAGGLVALIGGAWSVRPVAAGIGAFAAILTPAVVAGIFLVSVWHGNDHGLITAGSYAPYALLAAWVTWRAGRSSEDTARALAATARHDSQEGRV